MSEAQCYCVGHYVHNVIQYDVLRNYTQYLFRKRNAHTLLLLLLLTLIFNRVLRGRRRVFEISTEIKRIYNSNTKWNNTDDDYILRVSMFRVKLFLKRNQESLIFIFFKYKFKSRKGRSVQLNKVMKPQEKQIKTENIQDGKHRT